MSDVLFIRPRFKVISGGQTGADRAGLDWAIENSFPHGGWCPKGRKAEDGTLPSKYQLLETPSASYLQRTEWNVRDSDGTLIFTLSEKLDGGSKRTAEFAEKLHKPYLHIWSGTSPDSIIHFLSRHYVNVLNIAGKRESSAPGINELVKRFLTTAFNTRREN